MSLATAAARALVCVALSVAIVVVVLSSVGHDPRALTVFTASTGVRLK